MERLRFIFAGVLIAFASRTALADDAPATFMTRLFVDACLANVGKPEKVRAWALKKKLTEISTPSALGVFVGPGNGGAAWAIPTSFGSFALSIRGSSHACAVWARTADPREVEANFKKILDGVARPGLVVKIVKDENVQGPIGQIRTLIYSVSSAGDDEHGGLYTLQTSEKAGGAYQATLQAAKYESTL
jgi:hypothetical protein